MSETEQPTLPTIEAQPTADAEDVKLITRRQANFLMGVLAGKGIQNPDLAKTILRNYAHVEGLSLITYDQARSMMRELTRIPKETLVREFEHEVTDGE